MSDAPPVFCPRCGLLVTDPKECPQSICPPRDVVLTAEAQLAEQAEREAERKRKS